MSDTHEQPPLDAVRSELLARAARAARELCELLWEAMHEELRDPREQRVRELSQRISDVSSTVAMLTVPPSGGTAPGERRTPPEPIASEPSEQFPPPRPGPVAVDDGPPAARMRLVDEHEVPQAEVPQAEVPQAEVPQAEVPQAEIPRAPAQPPERPPINVRDVRREEGPAAWVNTVGRLIERHSIDGLPFAVLLVEVVDVAHIERSEEPVQVNNLIAQVEDALGRALRAHDSLSRESFGRYWLVAPETNGTGARMLAERLARLVRSSASHRGVPLEVAVGIAVCPEDGTEAPTLAARADLGVYSARATGRPVARTDPPA